MKTQTTSPLLGGTAFQSQVESEREAMADGVRRYRRARDRKIERGDGFSLRSSQRWVQHWYMPLVKLVRQQAAAFKAGENSPGFKQYGPVFCTVPAKKIAYLALRSAMNDCVKEPKGVTFQGAAARIGALLIAEAQMTVWKKSQRFDYLTELRRTYRKNWLTPAKVGWFARLKDPEHIYDQKAIIRVGAHLITLLQMTAPVGGYDEYPFRLAFHVKNQTRGSRKCKTLSLDKDVLNELSKDERTLETLRPIFPPMRVPPFKWSEKARGGYIELKTPLIKRSVKVQRDAVKAQEGKMDSFYECLECLGHTPMRVNPDMLKVVNTLYDRGGGVLNIPRKHDWEVPPKPTEGDDSEWRTEAVKIHRANIAMAGPRAFYNLTMNMAKRVAHWPALYFPHNCDWRQRCYPIPMYLNHHGDDLPRGLLEFADGVPCDSEGTRRIAIHAANLWKHDGIDKLPFDDRVQWVYDHLDLVLRSAADPLEEQWWMDAKKPLQFLAACMALRNPERAAHLRWKCDGTFNAMQWYSAMTLDPDEAALCNLSDSESPSVPYRMVAEKVRAQLQAMTDNPIAARLLPIINQDSVKSVSMTTTYGVTEYGARNQFADKIDEAGFDGMEWHQANGLVVELVMGAIRATFPKACAIMDYLKGVGRTIAAAGHLVDYISPLGFPVILPYTHSKTTQVITSFGEMRVWLDKESPPLIKKQSSSLAPHINHTMDSSHLLITGRAANRVGIAFSGVHDGYESHAQSGGRLGVITREQFVALAQGDGPLLPIVRHWQAKYPELGIPDPPERGSFDIRQVLSSRYFFS